MYSETDRCTRVGAGSGGWGCTYLGWVGGWLGTIVGGGTSYQGRVSGLSAVLAGYAAGYTPNQVHPSQHLCGKSVTEPVH